MPPEVPPEHSPRDREMVAAIFDRYRSAILAYFKRRLGDPAEAEDLTQEVFLSLLRRADVEAIENIEGYIFQTASNLLLQRQRTISRRPRLDGDYDVAVGTVPDDVSLERILLGREACTIFNGALQELPERARVIFVLNRFEAMSGREIADRLGVSISTVEKDMIRAIAFLRERLA